LRYAAIYRNPEALALFRANSTHKQLAVSVDVAVKREARIVELEAKLAELEPYRTFVEHMRAQMRREEQGRFGDLP
jgi:hypothetical protein